MSPRPITSVAIIGAGASGAAAVAALKAEDKFKTIKVFERKESAGGTWIYDAEPEALPLHPGSLPPEIDRPLRLPKKLPITTPPNRRQRYLATPIYDDLTTNVPDVAMSFTDRPFAYGPFVPHWIPRQYIESYFSCHHTDANLCLGTTVEDVTRINHDRWRLTLRKYEAARDVDQWWQEDFDALVIANGHYQVPFIPAVKGLSEFISRYPGRVEHSKTYRTPKAYADQRVLIIGNSASGYDISTILRTSSDTHSPVYVSRRSRSRWDGDNPPEGIVWKPVISEYKGDGTIVFVDGSSLRNIDKIIYCTGYRSSYPFWNEKANGRPLWEYQNDILINNYQHTFVDDFSTLAFIGIPRVLTFRSFEYQAIAIARRWTGRSSHPLPSAAQQRSWLQQRLALVQREHRRFHQIDWDTGETMDWFRWMFRFAGLPVLEGIGRCPPVLGPQTRWAIENIKKYPEQGQQGEEIEDEWTTVEARDTLQFI